MTNAEQAQGQLPELAALRQCLTELALPPAVRQTLDGTLTESEKRLQQRMEQMTWQIQRSALLGDIAGKIVHEIRNPLNAIFLHADVVLGELQCPTLDSRTQMMESLTDACMTLCRIIWPSRGSQRCSMSLKIWAIFSASAGASCRSTRGPVGSRCTCKDWRASALYPSIKGPYSAPS